MGIWVHAGSLGFSSKFGGGGALEEGEVTGTNKGEKKWTNSEYVLEAQPTNLIAIQYTNELEGVQKENEADSWVWGIKTRMRGLRYTARRSRVGGN